jgi:hypothetical protein
MTPAETASTHARRRLQQRAIPPMMIDLLLDFGATQRCGGAEHVFFDKAGRRRLQAHLGGARGLKAIESWLNVYAIVGDNGRIVTVAHRRGRLQRR